MASHKILPCVSLLIFCVMRKSIMKVALKKIRIHFDNGTGYIPIYKHPYCQAIIQNDRRIFDKFIGRSSIIQRRKQTSTWTGFNQLLKSLQNHFDIDKAPISIRDNICYHGRHRLCILAALYPDGRVKIKNGRMTKLYFFS